MYPGDLDVGRGLPGSSCLWVEGEMQEARLGSVGEEWSARQDSIMELLETGIGAVSVGGLSKCKYKLRRVRRGGEEEGEPRKRGPKPRLRSAGMSRYPVIVSPCIPSPLSREGKCELLWFHLNASKRQILLAWINRVCEYGLFYFTIWREYNCENI